MFVKLAVPGRCRSFAPGLSARSATPEVVGEDNEQLHHRRLVIDPEQWRNIEAHVVTRPPGDRRSNDKTVVRRAPALFVAKGAELKLDSRLQFLNQGCRPWDRLNVFGRSSFALWRRRRFG